MSEFISARMRGENSPNTLATSTMVTVQGSARFSPMTA
jgi:hypothetical protein